MHLRVVNILSVIILLAFVVRTIRNILYHLFLWQIKEYRLDRMLVHFRTNQGKKFLFGLMSTIKLALLIAFILSALLDFPTLASIAIWSFSLVIVYEAIYNLGEIINRSLPIPRFSIKTTIIFTIIFLSQLIWLITSSPRPALDYLPFLDKLLGFSIAGMIGLFSIPARLRDVFFELLAKDKIRGLPKLKVIGITGSYGKTTTKEFIAQLLSIKYKIAKTNANQNTLIGVSRAILNNVDSQTDYFVMEAAAYKKNEIKRIAELVEDKLEIVVITGLNDQHLDLFGTTDQISSAKYELIEVLQNTKTVVFNGNNKRVCKLATRARKEGYKVLLYGSKKSYFASAKEPKADKQKIVFKVKIDKKEVTIYAPIIGKHNIENILAALVVAYRLNIPLQKIAGNIKKLKSPPQTMNIIQKGKNIIIDDTYNANPDGVRAALDYLAIYKCKKILVLQPLIELAGRSDNIHRSLGKQAAKVCDGIILTNENFNNAFIGGVRKEKSEVKVLTRLNKNTKEQIEKLWKGKKVILFEGKESERLLSQFFHT